MQFHLPESRIAKEPVSPRDHSRLLVVHTQTGEMELRYFYEIGEFLQAGDQMVVNETKVHPVRVRSLYREKPLELMFMLNVWDKRSQELEVMVNRYLPLGTELLLEGKGRNCAMTLLENKEKLFRFKVDLPPEELLLFLEEIGETPLPSYLHKEGREEALLRQQYQSIFAKEVGSTAAPTASLHFTPELWARLHQQGVETLPLCLHVGLGTFAPLLPEHKEEGRFYPEHFFISSAVKARLLAPREGKRVCVGTTSMRALQAWALGQESSTDLLIQPGFHFQHVEALVTNFHLPSSSLLLLVEAFFQHKNSRITLEEVYRFALEQELRFYSFGDAMLIL